MVTHLLSRHICLILFGRTITPRCSGSLRLLEEVVEVAAEVARARAVGRGVTLDGDPQREGVAVVARVLVGDALDDRLHALEATAGVEVRTVAAAVDRGAAVRTLLERGRRDRQRRAARAAARHRVLLEHAAAARRV